MIFQFVTPAGVEPAISGMKAQRPRPLDDGAKSQAYIIQEMMALTQLKVFFEVFPEYLVQFPFRLDQMQDRLLLQA